MQNSVLHPLPPLSKKHVKGTGKGSKTEAANGSYTQCRFRLAFSIFQSGFSSGKHLQSRTEGHCSRSSAIPYRQSTYLDTEARWLVLVQFSAFRQIFRLVLPTHKAFQQTELSLKKGHADSEPPTKQHCEVPSLSTASIVLRIFNKPSAVSSCNDKRPGQVPGLGYQAE